MQRVPEVIDVWFDSGSMPFAQYHSPHEGTELFEEHFPADFICEALDQTRGWFYSLIAVSTLLFDRSPYRNVVCLGLILDDQGRKMSKSLGNTIAPQEVIDRFGADALRWYFFTSKQPWDGYRASLDTIGEARQAVPAPAVEHVQLLRAVRERERNRPRAATWRRRSATELDRWALSRLQATIEIVRDRMDNFDATTAGRAIQAFVDEISNWYVRRSRRRFWDGDPTAFATLRTCLLTTAKLLAPFCPFVADEIYDNLDGVRAERPPVRLPDASASATSSSSTRWRSRARPSGSGWRLAARRSSRSAGRCARRSWSRPAPSARRSSGCPSIVREELNVRELRFVSEADELGEVELKPNYRTLGPRFGKHMPLVAAAVAGLDAAHAAATLRDGGHVAISIDGQDHELTAEDLQVSMKPLEGYQVEREGSHAVALELEIDEELQVEGWAREIVRAVQRARQDAGLEVTDRIVLTLDGDDSLLAAARAHQTTSPARRWRCRSATSRWTARSRPSRSTGASCASGWPGLAAEFAARRTRTLIGASLAPARARPRACAWGTRR